MTLMLQITGDVLRGEDLPPQLFAKAPRLRKEQPTTHQDVIVMARRSSIENALLTAGGDCEGAGLILGMHRNSFYRCAKRFNLLHLTK